MSDEATKRYHVAMSSIGSPVRLSLERIACTGAGVVNSQVAKSVYSEITGAVKYIVCGEKLQIPLR
jgi:hypothetical protein